MNLVYLKKNIDTIKEILPKWWFKINRLNDCIDVINAHRLLKHHIQDTIAPKNNANEPKLIIKHRSLEKLNFFKYFIDD